jgi:hypothetical protein
MGIFFPAPDEVVALVKNVMEQYHPDLVKAKVDIGVSFAMSSNENQPSLKEHGQPTFGLTKIVRPQDRVRKAIDVELWLDAEEWGTDRMEHKLAKIDHLLMRLEVKKPKPKKKKKMTAHGSDEENQEHEEQEFQKDAADRPVLKMRKSDLFVQGGYREVMERHGQFAPESLMLDKAKAVANSACEVAKSQESIEVKEVVEVVKV